MLGNIIILLITWLLLRLKKLNLIVLTGSDLMYRLLQFMAGFVSSAFLAGSISLVFSSAANFTWQPTAGLGVVFLLKGFYTSLDSVLFEALLFRGLLLYAGVNLIGEKNANLTSAILFGMYHWFTFNVFGSEVIMLWVLVYTGLWGLMFSYAYTRTGSLALPVGLHLGWNFVDQFIFNSQGGSLFAAATSVHTRYLSTLEEMLYLRLPAIAFAVAVIVILCQRYKLSIRPYKLNATS